MQHKTVGVKKNHGKWRGKRGAEMDKTWGGKGGKRAEESRTLLTFKERRQRKCQNYNDRNLI